MAHLNVEIAHQLLNGRLPAAEADAAQRHLDDCRACRELVEREQSLLNILKLDSTPEPDEKAIDRLIDRVEATDPGRAARRRRRQTLTAASCVVAALLLAVLVHTFRPEASRNEKTAKELGISARQQMSIVSRLDALLALQEDRWLASNYETVIALDRHIREDRE